MWSPLFFSGLILILAFNLAACGSHTYEDPLASSASGTDLTSQDQGVSADTPPIATETLTQAALHCRSEVEQVWQKRSEVPKERRREFHVTLGIASAKCKKLQHMYKSLKETTHDERSYQQNLNHARAVLDPYSSQGTEFGSQGPYPLVQEHAVETRVLD